MIQQSDYNEGSIIAYSPFGGGIRYVKVDEKDSNIKNGRPGFGGAQVDRSTLQPIGNGVWGYDAQITRVVRK